MGPEPLDGKLAFTRSEWRSVVRGVTSPTLRKIVFLCRTWGSSVLARRRTVTVLSAVAMTAGLLGGAVAAPTAAQADIEAIWAEDLDFAWDDVELEPGNISDLNVDGAVENAVRFTPTASGVVRNLHLAGTFSDVILTARIYAASEATTPLNTQPTFGTPLTTGAVGVDTPRVPS